MPNRVTYGERNADVADQFNELSRAMLHARALCTSPFDWPLIATARDFERRSPALCSVSSGAPTAIDPRPSPPPTRRIRRTLHKSIRRPLIATARDFERRSPALCSVPSGAPTAIDLRPSPPPTRRIRRTLRNSAHLLHLTFRTLANTAARNKTTPRSAQRDSEQVQRSSDATNADRHDRRSRTSCASRPLAGNIVQ